MHWTVAKINQQNLFRMTHWLVENELFISVLNKYSDSTNRTIKFINYSSCIIQCFFWKKLRQNYCFFAFWSNLVTLFGRVTSIREVSSSVREKRNSVSEISAWITMKEIRWNRKKSSTYRMMKSLLHSAKMFFSLIMCSCCLVSTIWCFLRHLRA